ncbi:hypothetical protein, partial [Rhodovulum sulfidophilum]|uniref:hypothetical protein n=1 Tax=Rhodovulum sulfidophilum TaxID=35806 RepID=UPI001F20747D
PQTGKGPSRNAETAKRLTGKALALSSAANILRSQTGVFQQNRRRADILCMCERTLARTWKQTSRKDHAAGPGVIYIAGGKQLFAVRIPKTSKFRKTAS